MRVEAFVRCEECDWIQRFEWTVVSDCLVTLPSACKCGGDLFQSTPAPTPIEVYGPER